MTEKIESIRNYSFLDERQKKELFLDLAHIAFKHLKAYYNTRSYSYLSTENTLEEYSIESITPLFLQYGSSNQIYLQYQLENWKTPIKQKEHAAYFLYKIISCNIENFLIKKFKENDPFFAKIYSNVKFISNKKQYSKISILGTSYLVKEHSKSSYTNLIDYDSFDLLPEELFVSDVENILENLLNYLLTKTNYHPAIPINQLVRRIKKVYELQYSMETPDYTTLHISDSINVSSVIENAYLMVGKKVDSIYVNKSKITEKESIQIKSILYDISHALGNGGMSRGLFYYASKEFPNISKHEFQIKYHPILDYLVRLLKKEIVKELDS